MILNFEKLLLKLVNFGFEISLRKQVNGKFGYEIYTGAKSNLVIYEDNVHLCKYTSRYSDGYCEDYNGFLKIFKDCLCERDYGNALFFEFLVQEGRMTKCITKSVSYH